MKTYGKYILVDKEVHEVFDLIKWGRWMEDHADERRVARDTVSGYEVSTVFLGLDHSSGQGRPQLFETMVFAKKKSEIDYVGENCWRWATYDEALQGHNKVVSKLGGSNIIEVEHGQIKRRYRTD